MHITEKLDELLKARNMSRRQAAIKAGIPPSSFQSAMQRNGSMSVDMLQKIADVLDVSLSELLGDVGGELHQIANEIYSQERNEQTMPKGAELDERLIYMITHLDQKNTERMLDYVKLLLKSQEK